MISKHQHRPSNKSLYLFIWLLAISIGLLSTNKAQANQEHHIKSLDIVINTPDGFINIDSFSGLVQPQTLTTIRYIEKISDFENTKQQYIKTLVNIQEQQPITISDRNGLLIRHETSMNGTPFEVRSLLFGDKISTILLEATYPKNIATTTGATMLESLKSVRWLRMASEQLFKGLPFVADQSEQLQIVKRTDNAVVLIDPTPYDEQKAIVPLLVINSGNSEQPINEIEAFSRQFLKAKRFGEDIEILTQQATKVDNIQAFHIKATCTDKQTGKKAQIYQTVVYQQHRFLLIQGMVDITQAKQFWPQFEQITASVKFKKP